MDGGVLQEIGIAVGAALLLSLLFNRIGLPMIVGQIFAGMIVGPYGIGLIQDLTAINVLASLGIVLLLFAVGLELDPRDLKRVGLKALLLTVVEFSISITAGTISGLALGWTLQQSLFLGAVLSISSTAIVGRILMDRRSEQGQRVTSTIMSVLILEDITAVLLLLLAPEVGTGNPVSLVRVALIGLEGIILALVTIGFGRWVAPRVINMVSQYDLEIGEAAFLLALSFAFMFGVLSAYLGFSPAIGAFLIGLTLLGKHSRYIREKVAPIKDLFLVFFFVSMGALIDASSALAIGPLLAFVVVVAITGKMGGGAIGARLAKIQTPILIGSILIPRGEFSLILAKVGVDSGVAPATIFPLAGFVVLVAALAEPLIGRFITKRQSNLQPPLSLPQDGEITNK